MQLSTLLPEHAGKAIHWQHCAGTAGAMRIAEALQSHDAPILVLTPDSFSAQQWLDAVNFFLDGNTTNLPQLCIPDWETLPYDHFSPHQDITSTRLANLAQCPQLKKGLVVAPITVALQRLAPKAHVSQAFSLHCGQKLSIDTFRQQCVRAGYYAVSQVISHGEFAVRGELIDIFPMGSDTPLRIGLFDEEIESIRRFDPENQRTVERIDRFSLLPAFEFPLTEESIRLFRQQWRESFSPDPTLSSVYTQVSEGSSIGGLEYYLPLFFEQTETLFDYLPQNTCVVMTDGTEKQLEQFLNEVKSRHEQCSHDITRPILSPERCYLRKDELYSALKQYPLVKMHAGETTQTPMMDIDCHALPDLSVATHTADNRFERLKQQIGHLPCLITTESAGRADHLKQILANEKIYVDEVKSWHDFISEKKICGLVQGKIHQGFIANAHNMLLISEDDLFGQAVYQARKRQKNVDPNFIFKNLAELTLGSPVVHRDHGVGRYAGLQTMTVNDQAEEFLILEYADADKLYVPVANLDCISRYSGIDVDHAPIHRLGGPEWEKLKKKAAKRAHDVAADLLRLYAVRASREGHVFEIDHSQLNAFADEFPFVETPDQAKAITDIVGDMISKRPMDRLICGDVGFGKTEVAMRAAFIAATNNKQVAILVPTTLLAQQHYQSFQDRFSQWPINIGVLSRLSTAKEQQAVREKIESGLIDIVIGTHKILQSDLKFKNLQLIIIDEEHRFGVRQKEHLKSMRAEVELLSMTATPIPRSLNMAMAGIRDLSIISTPPAKRLAIRTFVLEYHSQRVKEAIQREMMRGGQVFYLHNNVETIDATAQRLQLLMPEAKIAVAHGQMRERELESVMTAFYHHQYHILVCTTIIETGIDIPTANTMIIDRADKFGLAQLHQLRGRVGRSHHQAYAYLIAPDKKALSSDAKKRLEAITQFDDLSVGFTLATLDLEIRGAGDFLGDEQSGHIQEIGYTLYQEMLDRAIQGLKSGHLPEAVVDNSKAELNFPVTTILPEDYIPDIHSRLVLYKRLADIDDLDELSDFRIELIDRFGALPEVADNLLKLTGLKIKARDIGIKKVDIGYQYGQIEFHEKHEVDPARIVSLIQKQPKKYQLAGGQNLKFSLLDRENTPVFKQFEALLIRLTDQ